VESRHWPGCERYKIYNTFVCNGFPITTYRVLVDTFNRSVQKDHNTSALLGIALRFMIHLDVSDTSPVIALLALVLLSEEIHSNYKTHSRSDLEAGSAILRGALRVYGRSSAPL
jgi:hypothetical protein